MIRGPTIHAHPFDCFLAVSAAVPLCALCVLLLAAPRPALRARRWARPCSLRPRRLSSSHQSPNNRRAADARVPPAALPPPPPVLVLCLTPFPLPFVVILPAPPSHVASFYRVAPPLCRFIFRSFVWRIALFVRRPPVPPPTRRWLFHRCPASHAAASFTSFGAPVPRSLTRGAAAVALLSLQFLSPVRRAGDASRSYQSPRVGGVCSVRPHAPPPGAPLSPSLPFVVLVACAARSPSAPPLSLSLPLVSCRVVCVSVCLLRRPPRPPRALPERVRMARSRRIAGAVVHYSGSYWSPPCPGGAAGRPPPPSSSSSLSVVRAAARVPSPARKPVLVPPLLPAVVTVVVSRPRPIVSCAAVATSPRAVCRWCRATRGRRRSSAARRVGRLSRVCRGRLARPAHRPSYSFVPNSSPPPPLVCHVTDSFAPPAPPSVTVALVLPTSTSAAAARPPNKLQFPSCLCVYMALRRVRCGPTTRGASLCCCARVARVVGVRCCCQSPSSGVAPYSFCICCP